METNRRLHDDNQNAKLMTTGVCSLILKSGKINLFKRKLSETYQL